MCRVFALVKPLSEYEKVVDAVRRHSVVHECLFDVCAVGNSQIVDFVVYEGLRNVSAGGGGKFIRRFAMR